MALDVVFIILTLIKVISLSRVSNVPTVLRIVIRDGAWAFVLVTSTLDYLLYDA